MAMRLSSSSAQRIDVATAERPAEATREDAARLPSQLGGGLRALYSVDADETPCDRLTELLDELAARERSVG
jgi:hypothetical protein